MDPPEEPAEATGAGEAAEGGEAGNGKSWRVLFGWCFALVMSLVASFVFSFVLGMVAFGIGKLSKSDPVSVSSTCRILSSSVDLKSSTVCELGTFEYKAKQVLYRPERSKYRCHYDYYWASVFEVEYKEFFSGQVFHAVAESPTEALPGHCRPDFGTAWFTRLKFKVNETYSCKYTLGSQKAEIYPDGLFNCLAKEPSMIEMVRRYFILFRRLVSEQETLGHNAVYLVSGVLSGFLLSIFTVIFLNSISIFALVLYRVWKGSRLRIAAIRRICLLVVYVSAFGWIVLQYLRIIGLNNLFFYSRVSERTA